MKSLAKLALFVVLLALPFAGRWFWFHRGTYQAPEIKTVEDLQFPDYAASYQVFADQPQPGNGHVVFDLYHDNNLAIDDLTPLRDRLAARGVSISLYDGDSESLEAELYGASALVVFVPTEEFSLEERQAVKAFIQDGGRLLLGADPTRPVPLDPELAAYDPLMIFFAESAIPAANSLANDFGISYFQDYLYNLEEYEGNYRNVRFTSFAENELTAGLDEVVCFAGHSLKADGVALFQGDARTLSDVRHGETGLSPAVLAADGQVLALGDISFLMAPYHLVADNDHFLSNLADWLATSERHWDLTDFPYLYERPVAIVQMLDTVSNPGLISLSSPLQASLDQAGITATLRTAASAGLDTLYLGTFEEFDPAASLLITAGVTVTVQTDEENPDLVDSEVITEEEGEDSSEEDLPLAVIARNLGTFHTEGTQLFVVSQENGRTSVVVLAEDRPSLAEAVERLVQSDFSDCLAEGAITVCVGSNASTWAEDTQAAPSGGEPEDSSGSESDATPTPGEDDGGPKAGKVFILEIDQGPQGKQTGAAQFERALSSHYEVTVWTVSAQGYPESADIEGYDAYIVDSGDFSFDEEELDRSLVFGTITDKVLIIGEQILPPAYFIEEPANLADLKVSDATHRLAEGFNSGQTLQLSASLSGVPALVFSESDMGSGDVSVVFSRGDASEASGAPVVIASESGGLRMILAGFAFYRLSEEDQVLFANNAIAWLMGD